VFAQGSDVRIAVLTVNLAVLVAMAMVEARLFHGALPCWRAATLALFEPG
jgi:hypothetical protein